MSRFAPKSGSYMPTDVDNKKVDRCYIAHINISAADAVATSANGVLTAKNLGAAGQEIESGITNPAVPRALSVVGSVAGITGDVVITGKNYADEEITETLALNGNATVHGTKAFKEIAKIELPAETHAHAAQVETIAVTAGCSTGGNITFTVTAAEMTGSPVAVVAAVTTVDDTTAEVAAKIRAALNANTSITGFFTVGGSDANIVLTAKTPAANDATMAMSAEVGATGVTFGASGNTTAGVAYDTVAVGWNDKLGLPYKLAHNTVLKTYLNNVLEGTAATVTTSATALESNTVDLNSALNGTAVDIDLMV